MSTEDDKDQGNGVEAPQSSADSASETVQPDSAEAAPPDPLAVAQAEAARFKDQLLRTAADFDNFRKRSRREVQDAERRGAEEMLKNLLPVFDNLERAGAHAEGATEIKAFADGIALVIRQFADTLSKLGIERIPTVGSAFDPALHEAVQHVETAEYPPGAVAIEVQPGYRMGDRLIRPAMVCVAKPPPDRVASVPDSGADPAEPSN